MDAAQQVCEQPQADPFDRAEQQTLQLKGIEQTQGPKNIEALAAYCLANPDARLVAGGTDLALEVTQRYQRLPNLISLNAIPELQQVSLTETELLIGAAAPISRCMALVEQAFPDFGLLLARFASPADPQSGHLGRQHRQRLADW